MAINKTVRKVLKAVSTQEIEVESSRQLANLKAITAVRSFHRTIDYKIEHNGYKIPTRIYFPGDEITRSYPVFLFFHGGGWVTESVDNYQRICAKIAEKMHHIVIAVEYRLAPEFPFPTGLEDCYAAAKAVYTNEFLLNVDPEKITLIGDSAGGNLTAAVSLMARDRGEFVPKRQILIYPVTNNDYSENSPFPSVQENGTDYGLTAGKMRDYINYYAGCEEDKQNPYFAPILSKDFSNQPKTLVITAEFDPLRDEGEAYGRALREAGNEVEIHRIRDAFHGFFVLGLKYLHVQESFEIIERFLREE